MQAFMDILGKTKALPPFLTNLYIDTERQPSKMKNNAGVFGVQQNGKKFRRQEGAREI